MFSEAFYSLATGFEAHYRSPYPQDSLLCPNFSSSKTFPPGMSVGTHVKAHSIGKSPSERALPSPARGAPVAGIWPAPGRINWSSCCSLRINRITESQKRRSKMVKCLRVQQKDHGSRFILHQFTVASFIRRRSSHHIKREPKLQEKFYPPPLCLPLCRENSISCVGISFSVNIPEMYWEVSLRILLRIGS